ncbi:MAG: hypothetical protein WBY53_02190 [Acidobacteriaceae bacterium]
MTPPLPSPLPQLDRVLLDSVLPMVPTDDRPDWLRCWQAELWHRHHPRCGARHSAADLYPGLLRDALWLRKEDLRRAFTGTAILCLVTLATLNLFALLPLFLYFGDFHAAFSFLLSEFPHFVVEAALTTMVGFAIASRVTEHTAPHARKLRFKAQLFLAAKVALLQSLAYLLSVYLTQPLQSAHPYEAAVLQSQILTVLALVALRWSFQDQDTRCRHCLRSLSAPLRVGRPSWNFLDSNGTHLNCPDGHGLLSVPEIETSWRQSSEWIAQ